MCVDGGEISVIEGFDYGVHRRRRDLRDSCCNFGVRRRWQISVISVIAGSYSPLLTHAVVDARRSTACNLGDLAAVDAHCRSFRRLGVLNGVSHSNIHTYLSFLSCCHHRAVIAHSISHRRHRPTPSISHFHQLMEEMCKKI